VLSACPYSIFYGAYFGGRFCGDCAIGTSGDYERFVVIDGVRYHHIFDTNTGYPCVNSQSATALVPTTEEAVVLSKILFIEGGVKYVQNTEGVAGLVIGSDGKLFYDAGLNAQYEFEADK
jgi:FAD:protein FMN transferase